MGGGGLSKGGGLFCHTELHLTVGCPGGDDQETSWDVVWTEDDRSGVEVDLRVTGIEMRVEFMSVDEITHLQGIGGEEKVTTDEAQKVAVGMGSL